MKATFKSMMVIGMMILGTVTSFANNNTDKNIDKQGRPAHQTECHLRHIHDANCGGPVVSDHNKFHPGMDKKTRKHMIKGKHRFNKHGKCKKCHFTEHEIHRMERGMHKDHHPTSPRHDRHDTHKKHNKHDSHR